MLNKLLTSAVLLLSLSFTAQAGLLSSTFAGGNGQDGNMFNIDIFSKDIEVTGFDLNIDGSVLTDLEFYLIEGGFQGFESNAAAWTLVSQGSTTGQGSGNPAFWSLGGDSVTLKSNTTYGVYLTTTGSPGLDYTNGSAVDAIFAQNADLAIREGLGRQYAFGTIYQPRIWNGAIHYNVAVPEPHLAWLFALAGFGLLLRRKA